MPYSEISPCIPATSPSLPARQNLCFALGKTFSDKETVEIVATLDANGSGSIDLQEFQACSDAGSERRSLIGRRTPGCHTTRGAPSFRLGFSSVQ